MCTLSGKRLNYPECHLSQIRLFWKRKSKWNYPSPTAGKLITLVYFLQISSYRCWQISAMKKIIIYKLLHNSINCVILSIFEDDGERQLSFSCSEMTWIITIDLFQLVACNAFVSKTNCLEYASTETLLYGLFVIYHHNFFTEGLILSVLIMWWLYCILWWLP